MPDALRSTMVEDPIVFRGICIAIILGLVISMSITAIQVALIRRCHLKDFKYQVLLGETKAVEERLKAQEPLRCLASFSLACWVQQEDVVEVMLKQGKDKIDFNHGRRGGRIYATGYHWACKFGNENIKTMIEEKAEELEINLELHKIPIHYRDYTTYIENIVN